jgi:S-formylglutathione hydrolase
MTDAKLTHATMATDLLPHPLEYALLTPPTVHGDTPLLYLLHGGGGDRSILELMKPGLEGAWQRGTIKPCVVATPSAGRSFYLNTWDGTQRWEDLLSGPFLEHVRDETECARDRASTAIVGISMGGMGGLRLAFKHPELFAGVAALEPGIEAALEWSEVSAEDRFFRGDDLFTELYGSPVDEVKWADDNPATIATRDPRRLDGLAIYLECGDEDSFGLHRGAEFLHRVLWDNGVSHQYRLVRGADHLGRTLPDRFRDAYAFMGQTLDPPAHDASLEPFHKAIRAMRTNAGLSPDWDPRQR